MKTCKRCSIEKELFNFSKKKRSKDGLSNWCKECNSEYLKSYNVKNKEKLKEKKKSYYQNNKEIVKERSKQHRLNNPDYHKEYHEKYYENNKSDLLEYKRDWYNDNSEVIKERSKKYREDNKDYYLEYLKEWRENNEEYMKEYWDNNRDKKSIYNEKYRNRLKIEKPHLLAWRRVLNNTLVRMGKEKSSSTIKMLGYSSEDLKVHLESLFTEGMSWENHGEWHIDHIYPVSKFDPNTDVKEVNALENLQPLWAFDNLSKGNKIIK
ncbi:MAG: p100 [uncultured marine phage]|uniref:p100 n=1 Tax=uncultured marine phage TaxID=707152 RepID=A0A8D9CFF4_9VIRU|nr:MAG: p100 [uncultured marine phage]